MRERPGVEADLLRRKARLAAVASWVAVLGAVMLPQSARAQFFFWDRPAFSAEDAARSVIARGFRPLARPVRNDSVYMADVIDRRGRHERLIVSADNGAIVQRFFLDDGSGYRRYADPSIPHGPVPPGRIPDEGTQSNVFSRLFSGDHDENATGVTPAAPDVDQDAPQEPRPRIRRRARVVDRTPDSMRPASPIESAPLAPVAPRSERPPAVATAPDRPADPASSRPARSISSNPLSLPGSREQDEKPRPTATVAEQPKPAAPKPVAVVKPVAPPPTAAPDVPVAPLD